MVLYLLEQENNQLLNWGVQCDWADFSALALWSSPKLILVMLQLYCMICERRLGRGLAVLLLQWLSAARALRATFLSAAWWLLGGSVQGA